MADADAGQHREDGDHVDDQGKAKGPKACDACKKRKIRCAPLPPLPSGAPLCAHCLSIGPDQSCTFTVKERAKRQPSKYSAQYVESLESRLQNMERLYSSLGPQANGGVAGELLQASNGAVGGMAASTSAPRLPFGGALNGMAGATMASFPGAAALCTRMPTEGVKILPSVVTQLAQSIDELSLSPSYFVGRESRVQLEAAASSLLAGAAPSEPPVQEDFWALSPSESYCERQEEQFALARLRQVPLPPPDLARRLVEAFFEKYDAIMLMLVKPYFDACVERGLVETDSSFRRLYLMVLAIGCRAVDDPRLPKSTAHCARGQQYFVAAYGSWSFLARGTLFDIQASALEIMWLMGSSGWITTWSCVRDAVRKAIDVGCHREREPYWRASALRDQLRKRAFFTLVMLDRHASVALGRPLAIQDHEFDVTAPLDISDDVLLAWEVAHTAARARGISNPEPPMGLGAPGTNVTMFFVQCTKLEGKCLDFLRRAKVAEKSSPEVQREIAELNEELDTLFNDIPEPLRWDATADMIPMNQSASTYAILYACRILLHQEFISSPNQLWQAHSALSISATAARNITYMFELLRQKGQDSLDVSLFYGPLLVHTAGLILLIATSSLIDENNAAMVATTLEDVQKCMLVLEVYKETTWLGSRYHASLVRHRAALQAKLGKKPSMKRHAQQPEASQQPAKRAHMDDAPKFSFIDSPSTSDSSPSGPSVQPTSPAFNFDLFAASYASTYDKPPDSLPYPNAAPPFPSFLSTSSHVPQPPSSFPPGPLPPFPNNMQPAVADYDVSSLLRDFDWSNATAF